MPPKRYLSSPKAKRASDSLALVICRTTDEVTPPAPLQIDSIESKLYCHTGLSWQLLAATRMALLLAPPLSLPRPKFFRRIIMKKSEPNSSHPHRLGGYTSRVDHSRTLSFNMKMIIQFVFHLSLKGPSKLASPPLLLGAKTIKQYNNLWHVFVIYSFR